MALNSFYEDEHKIPLGSGCAKALVFVALLLASFLVYSPSLKAPFISDDYPYIVENYAIRNFKNFPALFVTPYPYNSPERGLYRPMTTVSYFIDYKIWGLSASGFRAANIIFSALASYILFLIAAHFLQNPAWAFISALAFATHPVHTEAVAWPVGRAELLAGIFSLVSFHFYLQGRRSSVSIFNSKLALCWLFYFAAILSKETALSFPLAIAFYEIFLCRGQRGPTLKIRIASLLVISFSIFALYIWLRFTALGGLMPARNQMIMADLGLLQRAVAAVKSYAIYIKLTLLPTSLSLDYPPPGSAFIADWRLALAGGILALLLFLIASLAQSFAAEAFLAAWFLITLLPVFSVIPAGTFVAERFLFLPSAAFAILLALGIKSVSRRMAKLIWPVSWHLLPHFAAALIIASFGAMSLLRSHDWGDEERLWSKTVSIFPASFKAYNGLGVIRASNKNYDKAAHNYLTALTIWPEYGPARANMANLLNEKGFYQKAERLFRANIASSLDRISSIAGIGSIYANIGLWDKALEQYQRAHFLDEQNPQVNYNLAFVLSKLGDMDKPLALYLSAIEMKGDYWQAMNNLGNIYRAKGLQRKAMAAYEAAARLMRDSPLPLIGLGALYADMHEFGLAEKTYKKAIGLHAEDPAAHYNMGIVQSRSGKPQKAIFSYLQALHLKRNYPDAHINLGGLYLNDHYADRALLSYARALDVDPFNFIALKNSAIVLMKKQKDEPRAAPRFLRPMQ